ncbi:MAG TPA: hypothetical protein VE287_09885 [Actinopolymorphaceae bacterium]|nr:hypothetical protein [Actinopolymorphaceae bacterium]
MTTTQPTAADLTTQTSPPASATAASYKPVASGTGNPGEAVAAGVERVLGLARTWLAWDGRPRQSDDGDRIYTPHKAIRRYTHHLIDHLAEIEALLGGHPTRPDAWRASLVTVDADWARFTEADRDEAQQCLLRLADLYVHRLSGAGPAEWDRPRSPHWTLREIAEHVASPWYAEQVGELRAPS